MEENKTTQSIGEFLRAEREKRNITVEQLASATKIGVKLLHSLEADDFGSLPARPFVRGFVMAYAKYIGLNPQEVITRFEDVLTEKSAKKADRPGEATHIFVEKENSGDSSKTLLSVIMGGFLVAAIVIFAFVKPSLKNKRHKKEQAAQAVSNETIVTVTPPGSDTNVASSPAPTSKPTATPLEALAAATASPTAAPTPVPTKAATPAPTARPTTAPTVKPTAGPAASPAATPSGSTSIPYSEVKHLLVVRAVEDSWIKYQADDFPVRQYTLRKGQKIYVRGRSSVRFRCYNDHGVEISYDAKNFKPIEDYSKTLIIPATMEDKYRSEPFSE